MGAVTIKFKDVEDGVDGNKELEELAENPQAILYACNFFRFLERLGTNRATKLLTEVRNSGLSPPSFIFQSHNGTGSRTDPFFDENLPTNEAAGPNKSPIIDSRATPGAEEFEINCLTAADISLINVPIETIDPASLTVPIANWDNDMLCDNAGQDDVPSNTYGSPVTHLETPNEELPGVEDIGSPPFSGSLSDDGIQPACPSEIVMGLPTPLSDEIPTTTARKTSRGLRSSKSGQSRIRKAAKIRGESRQGKSSMICDQMESQLEPTDIEGSRTSIGPCLMRNVLSDYEQSLELRGLVKNDLSNYLDQKCCIWREKGFWFEDSLDLSVSPDHSAENRFRLVFRHLSTLATRGSDQKLRLRLSQTLLYLSFELLTREAQRDIQSGRLDNLYQHRASTLSVDHLLQCSYPDEWYSMDAQTKKRLRSQFHEHKRQGGRCWQTAGVLGLGALLVCGDTLSKVIKFPIQKLDTVLNYIVNAHPGVVSLYHNFDDVVKQILRGETVSIRPSKQSIDDQISQIAAFKLTPQQIEDSWQPVDSVFVSERFIEEFVSEYA